MRLHVESGRRGRGVIVRQRSAGRHVHDRNVRGAKYCERRVWHEWVCDASRVCAPHTHAVADDDSITDGVPLIWRVAFADADSIEHFHSHVYAHAIKH